MTAGGGGGTLLDMLGATSAGFLHARGEPASRLLIARLGCSAGDAVLDFGCGTGATLVTLASSLPALVLFGVDASRVMLDAAAARLRFCGLAERVRLAPAPPSGILPFSDGMFDRIYGESVLAILDDPALGAALAELHRLLRPGGTACFNETIWLDGTSAGEIERINRYCAEHFGIIQSSGTRPHLRDWASLFTSSGFTVLSAEALDALAPARTPRRNAERFSRLFTLLGKLKGYARPRLFRLGFRYRRASRELSSEAQRMEGVLFTLRRNP